MRHRVAGRKLNRTSNQRKSLFKNLVLNLFQHGRIVTTEAKAKSIRALVDQLITKAKPGTVASRRLLARFFGTRQAVNTLVDQVAPAFENRTSGFTRIVKIGRRRGDNAEVVRLELVEKPLEKPVDVETKPAKKAKKIAVKSAKKADKAEKAVKVEKTAKVEKSAKPAKTVKKKTVATKKKE